MQTILEEVLLGWTLGHMKVYWKQAYLHPQLKRTFQNYGSGYDINGKRLIRRVESDEIGNSNTDADYCRVYFQLEYEEQIPNGDIYVSDGYRNARVHRFSPNGDLINSWGEPGNGGHGQFHLPHSLLIAPDGKVYVCDRANRLVQIFTAEGEFITMWTGMGGPNDIARDSTGVFYLCEQAADDDGPVVTIRDGDGSVKARWEIRHAHGLWVDSTGDIYLGLTTDHSVDKWVRKGKSS